jgi:hypothetical protein
MSEDLLSLRMLLVGASQADCALWAQGVMRASVPLKFFSADAAGSAMPQGGVDIVIVDGGLSASASAAVGEAARMLRPTPLVVVCGGQGSARPPGVDGLLPCPTGVEEARRLANLCVHLTARPRSPRSARAALVSCSSTTICRVQRAGNAERNSASARGCGGRADHVQPRCGAGRPGARGRGIRVSQEAVLPGRYRRDFGRYFGLNG